MEPLLLEGHEWVDGDAGQQLGGAVMHHEVDGGGGEAAVELAPHLHDHHQEGHRADQPKEESDHNLTPEVEVDNKLETVQWSSSFVLNLYQWTIQDAHNTRIKIYGPVWQRLS